LRVFGSTVTHTSKKTGQESELKGIVETGIQLEERAPGDSSTYARLWTRSTSFETQPKNGDEITTTDSIYTIFRVEQDAGSGIWILLRYRSEVL
jgi:hypothetical protein